MYHREYQIEHDGERHHVVVDLGLSGHERIALDGRTISSGVSFSVRTRLWPLPIAGLDAKVQVSMRWYGWPRVTLLVDGKALDQGAIPGVVELRDPVPAWGWAFVAAGVAIPVVALGGALPAAIGFCAAVATHSVLRAPGRPAAKLGKCAAITVLAWSSFIALLMLAAPRGG